MSWTQEGLVDFLDRKKIPAEAYSFYRERDDAFCLDNVGDWWLVYYSERGQRNGLGWGRN